MVVVGGEGVAKKLRGAFFFFLLSSSTFGGILGGGGEGGGTWGGHFLGFGWTHFLHTNLGNHKSTIP